MSTTTQLQTIIKSDNAVTIETAELIQKRFQEFEDQIEAWKEKALTLQVTSADDVETMKQAREARLLLVKVRTGADKVRASLKADATAYNRMVQTVYNYIEEGIKPIEKHLQQQEDFIKIQQEKEREEIWKTRAPIVASLNQFLPGALDYKNMSEGDFNSLVEGAKLQQQAEKQKAEEAAKAAEATAKLRAEEEAERKRIEQENAQLKAEVAERARLLDEERKRNDEAAAKTKAEAEEKLRQETAARIAAEEKLRLQHQKELQEQEEKSKQERRLQSMSDIEKLSLLQIALQQICSTTLTRSIPEMQSEECRLFANDVVKQISSISADISLFVEKV